MPRSSTSCCRRLRSSPIRAAWTIGPIAELIATDPDAPDARNLFRVHWYNGADRRHLVSVPCYITLPPALSGVPATIVVVLGDRFPMIGAHKVLAAYACWFHVS